MDDNAILKYVNTFRNVFGIYLKPGVGMQIQISKAGNEIFICISLGFSVLSSTTFGVNFLNITAALNHYGIKQTANNDITEGTSVYIQGAKFAVVKSSNTNDIAEENARKDANKIAKYLIDSKKK